MPNNTSPHQLVAVRSELHRQLEQYLAAISVQPPISADSTSNDKRRRLDLCALYARHPIHRPFVLYVHGWLLGPSQTPISHYPWRAWRACADITQVTQSDASQHPGEMPHLHQVVRSLSRQRPPTCWTRAPLTYFSSRSRVCHAWWCYTWQAARLTCDILGPDLEVLAGGLWR